MLCPALNWAADPQKYFLHATVAATVTVKISETIIIKVTVITMEDKDEGRAAQCSAVQCSAFVPVHSEFVGIKLFIANAACDLRTRSGFAVLCFHYLQARPGIGKDRFRRARKIERVEVR